ncbi:hypothetical protein GCM10011405_30440 [Rufibacter glacialis]|nr:hypothetical protein GCM10011405_30440 [Rufibacter glacialis]
MNGIQIYKVARPEAVYMAMYLNHKSEAGQQTVTEARSYQFYLGMMNSMVRNVNGTLTDSASFSVGGVKGLDFSYTAQQANGTVGRRRNRVLFRKNMVYSLAYTPLVQATDSSRAVEERFLRSIEITKD